jgi:hypothetical protein
METGDNCYTALDGTTVTVYYHNGVWHFGSSSCPDINSSKFSNKEKTHGYMFDDILYTIYKNQVDIKDPNISAILRNLFTSNLSPLYSYDFVIIHHENKHVIDYIEMMGEDYKYLFHINTKNRITLKEENIDNSPLAYLNIRYPYKFPTINEAIQFATNNNYGFIVKKNDKIYKISNDAILHKEEVNAYNHNKWYNLLYVYMLQKDNYNINEFVNDFYLDNHADIPNNIYDIINANFNVIKNIIYNLYISTTKYYPKYNRFKVDLDMDRTLNPLIRFHLAQLRHQQTTIYKKKIINENNVFNYLCHSNNIKNIQKLFSHFATHNLYNLTPEIISSFATISNLLENNPTI